MKKEEKEVGRGRRGGGCEGEEEEKDKGGGGGCHRDASYYITADISSENDFHARFHNNNNNI